MRLAHIYVMIKSDNWSSNPQKKVSFREIRKRLRLNQSELASILKSDRSEISRLENGKVVPEWLQRAIILHRLLDKTGLTLDDVLLEIPDPTDC